jgi:hypothetical protein
MNEEAGIAAESQELSLRAFNEKVDLVSPRLPFLLEGGGHRPPRGGLAQMRGGSVTPGAQAKLTNHHLPRLRLGFQKPLLS